MATIHPFLYTVQCAFKSRLLSRVFKQTAISDVSIERVQFNGVEPFKIAVPSLVNCSVFLCRDK
jgi:hypothetical protein